MRSLLAELGKRADANARAELEAYERELPEYRLRAGDPRSRAETLDYAVWFRRHTVELVSENRGLSDEDLAFIGDIGRKRAEDEFSTGCGATRPRLARHPDAAGNQRCGRRGRPGRAVAAHRLVR